MKRQTATPVCTVAVAIATATAIVIAIPTFYAPALLRQTMRWKLRVASELAQADAAIRRFGRERAPDAHLLRHLRQTSVHARATTNMLADSAIYP